MDDGQTVSEPTREGSEKERWEIKVKKAEYWYKILIMIGGSVAAAAFFVYQYRQTESRTLTDLMSTRETADSQLRAEMFKTLFEKYFKSQANAAKPSAALTPELLGGLRQEVMLSDVLARNFENIDIRPILEDLDRRLVAAVNHGAHEAKAREEQRLAFELREELRRVAIGASARQVASLQALSGDSKARVTYHQVVRTCKGAATPIQPLPELPSDLVRNFNGIDIVDVKDGTVLIRMWPKGNLSYTQPFAISFYDMPALENASLPLSEERVAFSLYSYRSREACERFPEALDAESRANCVDFSTADDLCAIASFRAVILPKTFLGLHDRPYQTDLAAGRYRDPWWKVW
jgi:hypothetical protein